MTRDDRAATRAARAGRKLIIAVALLSVVGACAHPPRPSHVEILMNGQYAAPDDAWDRERSLYARAVTRIVRPGRHIVVVPITDNAHEVQPVLDETPPPAATLVGGANTVDAATELSRSQERLMAGLDLVANVRPLQRRTEIIAAIESAAERFGTDAPPTRKLMVLLTTGYEQSGFVNMADARLKLTRGTIDEKLNHIKETNALPSLTDVTVCMAGMSAGLNGNLDTVQQIWVRDFWAAFFEASHARLLSYNVALDGCTALDEAD